MIIFSGKKEGGTNCHQASRAPGFDWNDLQKSRHEDLAKPPASPGPSGVEQLIKLIVA